MVNYDEKLKAYLHDPVDKCFKIQRHFDRAKEYAEYLGVSKIEEVAGVDQIAACMERSFLPKEKIYEDLSEIRHPLCNKSLKLSISLFKSPLEEFKKAYMSLKKKVEFEDDRKKFYWIWRNLESYLYHNIKDKNLKKYLPLLPADTRIPDHSIWEHQKIASAINASLIKQNGVYYLYQNNSIFAISIGPVQSFLRQARKTQDFYLGSYLLSYLSFIAIKVFLREVGPTNVIFPDLYKQPLVDFWIQNEIGINPLEHKEEMLKTPTLPNRIVAILPWSEKEEMQEFANLIVSEIHHEVKKILDTMITKLRINTNSNIKKKIASQIEGFPEIFWVAVPWRIGERNVEIYDLKNFFTAKDIQKFEDFWNFSEKNCEHKPNIGLIYEPLFLLTMKFLQARKNVRTFKQFSITEKGRKCSVCGERDVIFFREQENKKKFTRYNEILVDLTDLDTLPLKYLSYGEGLCALCFLKRTFDIYLKENQILKSASFPSVSEIAAANFKKRALEHAKETYLNYVEKIKYVLPRNFPEVETLRSLQPIKHLGSDLDAQLLYEENLNESYIKKELGFSINPEKLKSIKESLKELISAIGNPTPYYAIIYFDGDDIGKWLSGEKLPKINNAYSQKVWQKLENQSCSGTSFSVALQNLVGRKFLTPAIHASISTALRNFSVEFVTNIVEAQHLGKVVFAGGDDVLAFVNIEDLFEVMQKLRWTFSGQIEFKNREIIIDYNAPGFVEKEGRYYLLMGPEASASAGIVIAHYKAPLQMVVTKAFEMVKTAKSVNKGKDTFAICMMRRSGEQKIAFSKWKESSNDVIDILKRIAQCFNKTNGEGFIAKSFIQKMSSELSKLKGPTGIFVAKSELFNVILFRLLESSYNPPKNIKLKKVGSKELKKMKMNFLNKTFDDMKSLFLISNFNIENFLNLCSIAAFVGYNDEHTMG